MAINVEQAVVVVTRDNSRTVVTKAVEAAKVVEVLRGAPGQNGVQNLFVGLTPPANPQENWIWVDIS